VTNETKEPGGSTFSDLPLFIERPGDVVGAPPYIGKSSIMQSFLAKGDRAAMQSLCTRLLSTPTGGRLIFHVLTKYVLFASIFSESMGSKDPVFASRGVVREWDIGAYILVAGGPVGDESKWRPYWMPAFLFVDTAAAAAAGREVFGYPKSAANLARDDEDDPFNPGFYVDVLHFPRYAPTQRPKVERLLTLSPAQPVQANPTSRTDVSRILAEHVNINGVDNLELPFSGMPQIMLRQFRDPVRSGRASEQAVIIVEPRPLVIRGSGLNKASAILDIMPSASHPILTALGLKQKQTIDFSVWLDFDFEVGWGRRIWP